MSNIDISKTGIVFLCEFCKTPSPLQLGHIKLSLEICIYAAGTTKIPTIHLEIWADSYFSRENALLTLKGFETHQESNHLLFKLLPKKTCILPYNFWYSDFDISDIPRILLLSGTMNRTPGIPQSYSLVTSHEGHSRHSLSHGVNLEPPHFRFHLQLHIWHCLFSLSFLFVNIYLNESKG